MTDAVQARLRQQAEIAIWYACRAPLSLKHEALASVSRAAIHYGLGGTMHGLSHDTIIIRAGFALGVLRPTG